MCGCTESSQNRRWNGVTLDSQDANPHNFILFLTTDSWTSASLFPRITRLFFLLNSLSHAKCFCLTRKARKTRRAFAALTPVGYDCRMFHPDGTRAIARVNFRAFRVFRVRKTRENVFRVRRNSREDISRRTSSLFTRKARKTRRAFATLTPVGHNCRVFPSRSPHKR